MDKYVYHIQKLETYQYCFIFFIIKIIKCNKTINIFNLLEKNNRTLLKSIRILFHCNICILFNKIEGYNSGIQTIKHHLIIGLVSLTK